MTTPTPAPAVLTGKGRPNPQIAQIKRTLYFLSRNTLAIIGLAILLFFLVVAIGASFYPAPNDGLVTYCGTTTSNGAGVSGATVCPGKVICTYPINTPPPSTNCFPVDPTNPSQVGPTVNLAHFTSGPLPFGSLTLVPSGPFFFNTFDGLIKGSQWSLGVAAGVVTSGALIGLMLGSIAGYFGGLVDEIIMRITDIFLSIPALLLTLVIIASIGYEFSTLDGRVYLLMLAFIITWWPSYTRIVRGQVLITREQKYVEASKASGAKGGRIIRKHIIPNSIYPVLVSMSLDVGSVPLGIGAIIFLGFQIFPTPYFPEWGTLAALAVKTLPGQLNLCAIDPNCIFPWWQGFFPGITLFMFAISVNFLSDGLRDALDPRLRR
ncbi:MAG: ABC transporter permease [Thermoplasmata archaeon]|nr:ABC transporter permease [Thermoplasmata archaeon]